MIGNQCKICKIYDDVFDAEYLYEIFAILQDKLQYRSDNTANRNTWPYGKTGTHKLFGSKIFFRQSVNKIIYVNNEYIDKFYDLFSFICTLENLNPDVQYLERVDVNLQHSGCDGTLHIDANPHDTTTKTFMIMANPVWKKEWGGAFEIFNQDRKEILERHEYVPGRVIVFPAHLPHRGLGAELNFPYAYRYSIVFGVRNLFSYD